MNHIFIDFIIEKCKKLFKEKLKDYDLSWKFLKISSMIDQIFIKILRIQNIQKKGNTKVKEENIIDTYLDVINYIIITLIKLNFSSSLKRKISHSKILNIYNKQLNPIKNWNDKEEINDGLSIDTIVENILSCKKKKNFLSKSKDLEKFYLKMLKMIIFLLSKNRDIEKMKMN
ncbi:DUF1599 domain-containing protein [Blattabacterium cuenoti]|uniref:DUF1599 domain-containing protein n=1 Tax=Blattabacterium cuenoti TaxID=1653831 RepID=UPI00163D1284|nr:DUF1599 domain-containing protein [Blattabacterium cuenoti]